MKYENKNIKIVIPKQNNPNPNEKSACKLSLEKIRRKPFNKATIAPQAKVIKIA